MLYRLLHRHLRQGLIRTFYVFIVLGLLPSAAAMQLETRAVKNLDTTANANVSLTVSVISAPPMVVYLESPALMQIDQKPEPLSTASIISVNAKFEPRFQVVSANTPILVSSQDYIPHNTHVFSRSGTAFNVATPYPGISVSRTLKRSGIFSIRCDLHSRMKAWIFSPPNIHYAVLQKAGTVNFSNLPPGRYSLHIWQTGEKEQVHSFVLYDHETISLPFR